jgi:hypothetical protein
MSTSDPCLDFIKKYSFAVSLTYVAIICTVVVNSVVTLQINLSAKREYHDSIDLEQSSLMTKIFLSTYVNSVVIVVIAFGGIGGMPEILKTVHIFQGEYEDFNQNWYAAVGTYFIITFVIQAFSTIFNDVVDYCIKKPLYRGMNYVRIQDRQSHAIVMQHELNMMEVGPVFSPTQHCAQLMVLLFFAMTLGPGIPILMPLSGLAFSIYFYFDKLLLLRYYQVNPHIYIYIIYYISFDCNLLE